MLGVPLQAQAWPPFPPSEVRRGLPPTGQVSNHFVSVERALSYTKLPQEPPAVLPADASLLEQGWPHAAAVSFGAVAMAYRPGLPLVLEHVSFSLPAGVKVSSPWRARGQASR